MNSSGQIDFDHTHTDSKQSDTGSKSSKVVAIILTIAGAGFLLLVAGIVFFYFRVLSDSTTLKTVSSSDGLAEISVPENWSTSLALNTDASMQVANTFTENYVLVFSENKKMFTNRRPGTLTVKDLNGYGAVITNQMAKAHELRKTVLKPSYSIDEKSAILYRLKGRVDGVPIVYWLGVVDGENHYHQVLTWTLVERADRNREKLLRVIESFREL